MDNKSPFLYISRSFVGTLIRPIGSRATFGIVALELAKTVDDLMILTADVSTSAGLERFRKRYPDKYLDVGIAEQNLIGIAAGLASEGLKVLTTTFAPFQTMRCCEQIKVNLGYMRQDVCMVGLASGVVLGTLGYSHCCIEDISIIRSIPGITVISPADCGETAKALFAAVEHKGPVYIRLTGGTRNPIVYDDDYEFSIGKGIIHREGENLAIISTGTMVYESLRAADLLAKENIFPTVIDMHTIKPIDTGLIYSVCENSKLIVTVEEHNVVGGLGSAISEEKSKIQYARPQLFIGIPDKYGKSGQYRDLLQEFNLTAEGIADQIKTTYNNLR